MLFPFVILPETTHNIDNAQPFDKGAVNNGLIVWTFRGGFIKIDEYRLKKIYQFFEENHK